MSDDPSPYRIIENDGSYIIQDPHGNTVLELRDQRNAEHYRTLLNKAYRVGYKAGYREKKNL